MDLSAATAYVTAKYREFQGLFLRLLNLQHAAALEAKRASEAGALEAEQLARDAVSRIARLIRLHASTEEKLDQFRSYLEPSREVQAFGAIPVVWAATVIAVAGAIAYIFARVGAEERIVRELQRGTLTAAEATELLKAADAGVSPGQALGDALRWVAIGAALWFGVALYREAQRR